MVLQEQANVRVAFEHIRDDGETPRSPTVAGVGRSRIRGVIYLVEELELMVQGTGVKVAVRQYHGIDGRGRRTVRKGHDAFVDDFLRI